MQEDNEFLFVYGSLRSESNHPMSLLLTKLAKHHGDASFNGQLYDAGSYPAAVDSEATTDKVYGELYELFEPKKILTDLDNYEGYNPQNTSESLFIRKKITIRHSGKELQAWIYLFNRSVRDLHRIPSGNYLTYLNK